MQINIWIKDHNRKDSSLSIHSLLPLLPQKINVSFFIMDLIQTLSIDKIMRKKPKVTFATILHLSEMYCEQYRERSICLSPEQNETSFRDFVAQYYSAQYWRTGASPVIDPDVLLF